MCLEIGILIVQILVLGVLLLTVIYARKAAIAAENSAASTLAALKMQCFTQLLDAYSSPDMLDDMITLIRWKDEYSGDWAEKYGRMMKDKYMRKDVLPIHEARRHYAHHFHKIRMMYQVGYLDENRLDDLASNDQIDFLLETVEPLEKNLNPDYDDSTYRFFENLRDKRSQTTIGA